MKPLPAGLADPLHLTIPIPWRTIFVAAALLALVALSIWLLRLWLRRRQAAPPPAPEPPPLPGSDLAAAIERLRGKHHESGTFRAACHELSTLLRGYLERARRQPYSTLTASEIHDRIGDGAAARFFALLAGLQFGRRRPSANDLDGACDIALVVARDEEAR